MALEDCPKNVLTKLGRVSNLECSLHTIAWHPHLAQNLFGQPCSDMSRVLGAKLGL